MAAVPRRRDYRSERHAIVMVQSQTGDKWESCLRSPKVCRNSLRYVMMLRVSGNLLMQHESVVSPRKGREKVRYGVLCPCCDLNKETSGPKHGKGWGWDTRKRPCSSPSSQSSGWCPIVFHPSPLQSLL